MYFAVAYGHVVRFEKAADASEAVRLAFGVPLDTRSTVKQLPHTPRSMSQKLKTDLIKKLAHEHFHRTGNILSGFENEPDIKNVHWTKCPLCYFPITTEPASAGEDDKLCSKCEPKVEKVENASDLSICDLREKIGLPRHIK